jgi:hypothetical protein
MIPPTHNTGYRSINTETTSTTAEIIIPKIAPDLLDFQSRYPATILRTPGTSKIKPNIPTIQADICVRSPMNGIPLSEDNKRLAIMRKILPPMPIAPNIKNKIDAAETIAPL